MSEDAKFIDISDLLGKVRSRVDLVGIELEGGWTKLPRGTTELHPDGSVSFAELMGDGSGRPKLNGLPVSVGEIVSPPMPISMMHEWVSQHYPQAVNKTCGLHIHMSFKSPLIYQRLMDPTYGKTILEFVSRWAKEKISAGLIPADHPIIDRLLGTSQYCQDRFYADAQAAQRTKQFNRQRDGNRYTVVNYCYGLHQTVEIRLLPMFATADLAEDALLRVIAITNAWLVAGRKIPKLDLSWKLEEDKISEERIECV